MKGYFFCGKISTFCGIVGILLLAPGSLVSQPNWSWVESAGSSSYQRGYAIAADTVGNTITTGFIRGLANNFDGNLVSSNGADDVFIAKYDADGNNIWVKHAGGPNDDHGRAVAMDNAGNIYVCGEFSNSITFYGSPNIFLNGSGNDHVFVAKFNSSGNVLWAKQGISNDARACGITTDGVNVYITGQFDNSITFGPLNTLSSTGNEDIFIASFAAVNGAENWSIRGGSGGYDEGNAICMDATGIYVTGCYSATVSFQNMSGSMSCNGSEDVYLVKYDFNGNGIWKRRAGSIASDDGHGVSCSGDRVYVGGRFAATLNFYNSGPSVATLSHVVSDDAFVLCCNATTGNYIWAQSESGTGSDEINGITVNPRGDVITTGSFTGLLPMGPGPAQTASGLDLFVIAYDSTGNFLYGQIATGSDEETGNSIAAPINDVAFVTGYFKSGPATFGNYTVTTNSNDEIFVAQLGCLITQAVAGTDQEICLSTTSLSANAPVYGTGQWSLISGAGVVVTPGSPGSLVVGLAAGDNLFEWSITNNSCVTTDTVLVRVQSNPTPADAGDDQHICSPTTVLDGNTPVIGTGLWIVTLGNATLLDALLPNTVVNNLSPGTNEFVWITTIPTCPLSTDTVVVRVDEDPTPASAGADQVLCANAGALLANDPSVGAGMWTVISGPGSVADPDSAYTQVSNLAPGQNIFQWTISNGVCPSSSDQLIISVDALPTLSVAGSDQQICSPVSTLAGNIPAVGAGTWSLVAGTGSVANPSAPSTAVSGMTTPVNIFEWRITNGVCPSSVDSVIVTIDSLPTTAAAGNDRTHCTTSDTLTGNVAATGTGQWTLISGTGTPLNPSSPVTAVAGLSTGQNIFQWTITNGTCPNSSDQVIITVDAYPSAAYAGIDARSCSPADSVSGNVPLAGTGMWTVVMGGAGIANPLLPATAISNLTPGNNLFEWRITNGTCPVSRDTVSIEYNEAPSPAMAGPDILVCSHDVIMQAQTPLVGTGVWGLLPGSIAIPDSTNPQAAISGLPDGTWFYTWTTQNGFCVSAQDTVAVFIYSPPTVAYAGTDRVIYTTFAYLNANPADTGMGTWSFVQGSGTIQNVNDPTTRVDNLSTGINVLRWTTSNGVCDNSEDDVRIEVHALIIPTGYSPNGDGVNDQFEIIGLNEYPYASLEVFNRWGNSLYTSSEYANDWNGTGNHGEVLPDDIYYYVLTVGEDKVFTGFVAIKRTAP